jgi:hypothetical protein
MLVNIMAFIMCIQYDAPGWLYVLGFVLMLLDAK